MKKIINDIKEKGRLMMLSCCTILGLLLASCDYWHDSYEGCEELLKTHLKVQFIYDMNMKFADAFPHEVKNVTLYAFDQQGKLAYVKTEAAEKIVAEEGMNIDDLTSGIYDLLVWAQGEERYADSYTFGQASIGSSACDVLKATVNRADKGIIDHDLTPLFHGQLAKANLTKMEKGEREPSRFRLPRTPIISRWFCKTCREQILMPMTSSSRLPITMVRWIMTTVCWRMRCLPIMLGQLTPVQPVSVQVPASRLLWHVPSQN